MNDQVYYLPVRLISHNGGTGSHSYFAVRPVDRDPEAPQWPLFLSPDGMHLLYIHPSQLLTAPDAQADTLEEIIAQKRLTAKPLEELLAQKRNARLAAEIAKDGTIQPGAKRD